MDLELGSSGGNCSDDDLVFCEHCSNVVVAVVGGVAGVRPFAGVGEIVVVAAVVGGVVVEFVEVVAWLILRLVVDVAAIVVGEDVAFVAVAGFEVVGVVVVAVGVGVVVAVVVVVVELYWANREQHCETLAYRVCHWNIFDFVDWLWRCL